MKAYEALVIVRPGGTEQDVAQQAARLEEPIKKLGGRIETLQPMGRRRLAFRIARQSEGYYYLLRFEVPPEQIAELERLLRLNELIVRFIILSQDELGPVRPAGDHESRTGVPAVAAARAARPGAPAVPSERA